MFDFTESVAIEAPHDAVWRVMSDLDGWWPASNPEHIGIEHLDDRPVTEVGARLRIREKIGGIPGEAVGTITEVEAGELVTWEADATYRWLAIRVTVTEGVTWRVRPQHDGTTKVSARVWATNPPGIIGRIAAFTFVHLLGGERKDREHTRAELCYLKRVLEERAST